MNMVGWAVGTGRLDSRAKRQETLWRFKGRNPLCVCECVSTCTCGGVYVCTYACMLISSLASENRRSQEACLWAMAGLTWTLSLAPCGLVISLWTLSPSPFALYIKALITFKGSDIATGIQQCKRPGLPHCWVLQAVCRPRHPHFPLAGKQATSAPSICRRR